jgi:hypothetical protein
VSATILLAEPIDWSAPGERPVRLPQCRLYDPVLRLGGQAGIMPYLRSPLSVWLLLDGDSEWKRQDSNDRPQPQKGPAPAFELQAFFGDHHALDG